MSINATEEELAAVIQCLNKHRGKDHAIKLDELAFQCGLHRSVVGFDGIVPDRRKCELILQLHAEAFPFVVCADSNGVFVAVTPEELNHERNSRMSRIKNIAQGWRTKRRKALELGWKLEAGQFVEAPLQQELAF